MKKKSREMFPQLLPKAYLVTSQIDKGIGDLYRELQVEETLNQGVAGHSIMDLTRVQHRKCQAALIELQGTQEVHVGGNSENQCPAIIKILHV